MRRDEQRGEQQRPRPPAAVPVVESRSQLRQATVHARPDSRRGNSLFAGDLGCRETVEEASHECAAIRLVQLQQMLHDKSVKFRPRDDLGGIAWRGALPRCGLVPLARRVIAPSTQREIADHAAEPTPRGSDLVHRATLSRTRENGGQRILDDVFGPMLVTDEATRQQTHTICALLEFVRIECSRQVECLHITVPRGRPTVAANSERHIRRLRRACSGC